MSTVLFRTRRSHPTLARVLPGSGSNVLSLWAEVGESSRGLGRIKMTTIASFISMSIILVCGLRLRNDVLTHRNFLCFRLFDTFLIPKHESVTMEHRVEFPVRSRAARSSIQLHLVECIPPPSVPPLCGGPRATTPPPTNLHDRTLTPPVFIYLLARARDIARALGAVPQALRGWTVPMWLLSAGGSWGGDPET